MSAHEPRALREIREGPQYTYGQESRGPVHALVLWHAHAQKAGGGTEAGGVERLAEVLDVTPEQVRAALAQEAAEPPAAA